MSMSLVWQPSRSTSLALAVAIASISDTISLIVAYYRLTIPLCIVSTPPKKGPQHCGPEAIFLVHHHCRISTNKQRHLPYPISNNTYLRMIMSLTGHNRICCIAIHSLSNASLR
ncbi:hypothetical protein BHE74_00049762 [Ensete ventricosum]|nr:hypothetical protein BHE74_00049762 [Ensete ventricosum]